MQVHADDVTAPRPRRLSLRLRERLCSPRERRAVRARPTGKSSERSTWRLLDHKSDSAAALADRHESRDRKAPSWPEVGAGVAPEFMPKHNSEPIGNGGSTGFDAALSRLAKSTSLVPCELAPAFMLARVSSSAAAWLSTSGRVSLRARVFAADAARSASMRQADARVRT